MTKRLKASLLITSSLGLVLCACFNEAAAATSTIVIQTPTNASGQGSLIPGNAPIVTSGNQLNDSGVAGGSVASLPSIASLRAMSNTPGSLATVVITGYYAGTSIGGGTFNLEAPGCSDDGWMNFKTSAGDCFQRVVDGRGLETSMFGVYSDGVTTVLDGSITAGSNQFTSILQPCTAADIGKIIELNPAGATVPWVDSIIGCNGGIYTLADNSPITYPGPIKASSASFGATDAPGSGAAVNDTLTCLGGTFTSQCTASIVAIQYVGPVSINTPGSGYTNNDILTGQASGGGSNQKVAMQIQLTVSGGVPQSATVLYGGVIKGGVPTSITWSGGTGTGFTTNLLASNGSFGLKSVSLVNKGSYTVTPTNPVLVSGSGSETGNPSIDVAFSGQDWTKGHDDTTGLQNAETIIETLPTTMRGMTRALRFPQSTETLLSCATINAAVSWRADGPLQAQLVQIPGSAGCSVNGSPHGALVVAPSFPVGDDFQRSGYTQPMVTLENFTLRGMTNATVVDVGSSTNVAYTSGGFVAANPAARQSSLTPIVCKNMIITRFPGDIMAANGWIGDFRCEIITLSNSGSTHAGITATSHTSTLLDAISNSDIGQPGIVVGNRMEGPGITQGATIATINSSCTPNPNCMTLSAATLSSTTDRFIATGGGHCLNMSNVQNPTRFYELVTSGCNRGLYLFSDKQYEFHGWTAFSNNVDIETEGYADTNASVIDIIGGQCTDSFIECAEIGQANLTVQWIGGTFHENNIGGSSATSYGDCDIVVEPSAGSNTVAGTETAIGTDAVSFTQAGSVDGADNNVCFRANQAGTAYANARVKFGPMDAFPDTKQQGYPVIFPASQSSAVVTTDPIALTNQTGLTALIGGGQANATPTVCGTNPSGIASNTFSTVTNIGDSGGLPVATGSGCWDAVRNNATNAMVMWANGTDVINNSGAGGSKTVNGNSGTIFIDTKPGKWATFP